MTRRQVRARMRRMKEKYDEAEEDTGEINLVPYMDIVTQHHHLLARIGGESGATGNGERFIADLRGGGGGGEEEKPSLNLTVDRGQLGLYPGGLGRRHATHPQAARRRLRLRCADHQADRGQENQFKDETKATFNADAGTAYETRDLKTLDAMREDKDGTCSS